MIIDMHCDTLLNLRTKEYDLKNVKGHISLDKLISSNYLVQCFAVFTHLKYVTDPKQYVEEMISAFKYNMDKFSNEIRQVYNYNDIIKNQEDNIVSALLTIEELGVIHEVEELDELYQQGVRMATLTWNFANDFAYPAWEFISKEIPPVIQPKKGLTEKGIKLVKRMEELGIIIDVAHLNDEGIYDILKYTTKPFVASHSNARSICDVSRNLPDDLLLKMKERGCVIGINYCPDFVKENSNNVLLIEDLIKHIDYLKELIGIDYIGLGSDFDGIDGDLEIKDASFIPLLIERLKEHGYSDSDIGKITYKNVLNLFKKVL